MINAYAATHPPRTLGQPSLRMPGLHVSELVPLEPRQHVDLAVVLAAVAEFNIPRQVRLIAVLLCLQLCHTLPPPPPPHSLLGLLMHADPRRGPQRVAGGRRGTLHHL